MTKAPSTADWGALRASIAGEVLLPSSAAYESARAPAMARFRDVAPAAVVRCHGPGDVVGALALARLTGVEVAVRSGGHCFAGRSSTPGMLIDVGPIDGVSVGDGVVTIGAGAKLGRIYDALEPTDRTIVAGCGPSVGIAGLTLGGGVGILGRRHGLTSDQLLVAEVVLADGRIVWCDELEHADLFWALRGAGGARFGVVTSLILATVAAPDAASFELRWPPDTAATIIGAW